MLPSFKILGSRVRAWVLLVALSGAAFDLRAAETATTFRVEETTIADIQAAILAKKLTATQLVHLYLARIKAYNGPGVDEPEGILGPVTPKEHAKGVNALVTLNLRPETRRSLGFDDRKARTMTDQLDNDPALPDALETAARLDAEFAKTGKLVGPLHGVVLAIKDQYDTVDMRSTSGADAFYANDRPPDDSLFVTRLRAAGAIILAKANAGEYASGIRSAFGGTTVNAYDTSRVPGGSSGGSGVATAVNLVTATIGEESGPSVRAPATYANSVGIAATQELVPRDGMINIGINTRVGPIARTVEDAARLLTVIAGYDPKDELTAFAVGRMPTESYETFTKEKSLKGVRIGVVREYMDRAVFSDPVYGPSIDLAEQAIEDLRKLGATIVDGGPEGLFTPYIRKFAPMAFNSLYTKVHPELFPVDAEGKPVGDHLSTLAEIVADPAKFPDKITMRDLGRFGGNSVGESRFGFTLYLKQRGDANIKTVDDLVNKANFFKDAAEGDKKASMANTNKPQTYEMAYRLQRRFAVQQIVLACMADLKLDAVVYPTSNIHPRKIGMPRDPSANGIGNYGMWTFIGAQGLPAITVPAGFTKEVYDRIPDPAAKPAARSGRGGGEDEGPAVAMITLPAKPAKLPVGIDFMGRPFSEPVLLKIAGAYEHATKHRAAPADFGPLP